MRKSMDFNELLYCGLDEVLLNILEREVIGDKQREIELITAQLEVLDIFALEHISSIENALETKLEYVRNDLLDKREYLLREELKKRMINSRYAWSALKN